LVDFLAALQFLTLTPPVLRRAFTPAEMGRATAYYPLVGWLLGVVLAWVADLLDWRFFAPLVAALVLTLWVASTGGLHLDGFLDACDGLLGGATPERRLEIMRDHAIGAFAFVGGALLFLTKFSALIAFKITGWQTPALLLAPVLGRWAMTLAIAIFPYARAQGLGREMKAHVTWRQVLSASITVLVVAWVAAGWHGLIALALAALTLLVVAYFTLRRIPGLTGDIYGAVCELTELVVLLLFAVRGLA
jgi:adenosylcobinamide-GDP ribazoletransferase